MKDAKEHPLRGRVVVITGASGGIGRETARQFAMRGATLVLAARRPDDLEETARLCREVGPTDPLIVVTDVTREEDVARLTEQTLGCFGGIDVWVNNAGVTLFAMLDEASFADHRRVIETNLYGPMHAARAVLPVFKRQHQGTMINVGSILSKVGQPYVASYVISKFALRGMSEVLRAELAEEPDVHICTIFPYAVDTPHFQSGANVQGRQALAMPPAQKPERVAAAIVALALRPRREVHVPRIAVLGLALHWALPRTTERLLLRALTRFHFSDQREPRTDGNIYQATEQSRAEVHGRRTPRVSTVGFVLWSLRELGRMELSSLRAHVDRVTAVLGV